MADSFDCSAEGDRSLAALEQWIRQAGSYVEVSEDLRPRVLERARERRASRSSAKRAAWVLTVMLAIGCGFQALGAHWRASSTDIIDRSLCLSNVEVLTLAAAEATVSTQTPPAWNVADVFAELRNRRAKRFDSAL